MCGTYWFWQLVINARACYNNGNDIIILNAFLRKRMVLYSSLLKRARTALYGMFNAKLIRINNPRLGLAGFEPTLQPLWAARFNH